MSDNTRADGDLSAVLAGKSASELTDKMPDELRGKTPDELTGFIDLLDAHLKAMHQDEDTGELRDKTAAEETAFAYGLKLRERATVMVENHRNVQEVFKRRPKSVERVMANLGRGDDAYGDVRRMPPAEARDKALRALDSRSDTAHLREDQKVQIERQIRRDPDIARRILVTENEDYREAWMKLVTQPDAIGFLSDDERNAVRAYQEYRAMSENTTTAGGFGIPVKLAA